MPVIAEGRGDGETATTVPKKDEALIQVDLKRKQILLSKSTASCSEV